MTSISWIERTQSFRKMLTLLLSLMTAPISRFFNGPIRVQANVPEGAKLIPEPPAGVFGHMPLLMKGDNQCAYDALVKIRKQYGDVCQFRILGKPWILVSDAEAIQKILVSERERFPKKGDAVEEMKVLFGEQGILVTEGEQWLRQRKMCMPAFRHEQLLGMVDGMNQVAKQACQYLKRHDEVEALSFMSRAAFANICQAGFDYHIESLEEGFHDPILDTQEMATRELVKRIQRTKYWKKLPLPSNFKLANLLKEQEKILKEIIAEKKENTDDAKILLNEFLRARDDNGGSMTETELLHMCMQFMAAGHETTGAALQWTLFFLATHPDVQAKVLAEADSILGDKKNIDFDDVKKMTYFEQVFNESMRVRAPIPVMVRMVAEDTVINGNFYPKDAVIMIMVGEVQRDTRYWGNDAEFFNPEHFAPGKDADRPRAAFIPFGLGPRLCIGHRFTMLEAAILIVQLLREYRFSYIPGQNVDPFLRTTWSTKNGIRLQVTPRN